MIARSFVFLFPPAMFQIFEKKNVAKLSKISLCIPNSSFADELLVCTVSSSLSPEPVP